MSVSAGERERWRACALASVSAGELLRKNKKKEMLFTEKKINSVPVLGSVSAGEYERW